MRANVDVVLGLQWGDEGKGKVVDYLSSQYEVVARFQGGPNAGHTLVVGDRTLVLHQLPSGILRDHTINVIGNGVVIDPIVLAGEIGLVVEILGSFPQTTLISRGAHIILPTHVLLDMHYEELRGKQRVGSTLRGTGPAYEDKVARRGLRMEDILKGDFDVRYRKLRDEHLTIMGSREGGEDLDRMESDFFEALEIIRPINIVDTSDALHGFLGEGKSVLAEGAQGTMLDIDFGSYPFVTSSNTVSSGACSGLGVPPSSISKVIGVLKAYSTRVGNGPFPTELHGEKGEELFRKGNEFGATTGRPRRCGWLDIPLLRRAIRVSGATELCLTKVDVLSGMSGLQACEQHDSKFSSGLPGPYQHKMREIDTWVFEGEGSLSGPLMDFIKYLEGALGVPIVYVSTGPGRDKMVFRPQ